MTPLTLRIENGNYKGWIDRLYFEFPANGEVNYKVSSKPSVGLDFGMVYEWRPDWQDHKYDMDGETNLWRLSHNKYKLRVGLSITDLGVIRFERGEFSNNFIADVNNFFSHTTNIVRLEARSRAQSAYKYEWAKCGSAPDMYNQRILNLPVFSLSLSKETLLRTILFICSLNLSAGNCNSILPVFSSRITCCNL